MISQKQAISIGIGAYITQGLIMTVLIYHSNKIHRQGLYFASIVQKNLDRLDEFDIIALRELGSLNEDS
jgi:hypothetical protein